MNFRHRDPSIAYIESEQLRHDEFHFDHADNKHPGHEDYNAFDHHYLRYAQVLDTDYSNFVIVYSCQEGAHYYDPNDKSEDRLPIEDADDIWEHVKRLPNPKDGDKHMRTAYEVGVGIEQQQIHKERVQVLWRMPSFIDEMKNNEVGNRPKEPSAEQLQVYMKTITELVPKSFSQAELLENYGVMNHTGNSKAHDVEEGLTRGYNPELKEDTNDPKNAEEQDLYDGGKCNYDPYFLFGFVKFGEEESGDFLLDDEKDDESMWGEDDEEEGGDSGMHDTSAMQESRELSGYDVDEPEAHDFGSSHDFSGDSAQQIETDLYNDYES